MSRVFRWLAPLAAVIALASGPAAAQDAFTAGFVSPEPQYLMNLGVGGAAVPRYPGSDKYMFVPYPIIEAGRFYIPYLGQTERKVRGIYVYPSLNVIGERKPSDDNSLKGTKDIDWAFEAGIGGGFRYDWFRAYATIRQGFNGYSGQTGELGADLIVPMGERFEVSFGPRASWASDGYMETYFGVTEKEASRGILTAYKADAGFKTVGIAGQINYWVDNRTRLQLRGSWNRLIGDAGDSPIVKYGDANQWMVGLGISRKFEFNLFR
jgi:outer membrane scaffolding protein for murein synthesis (MipA/OmpV family)